MSPGQLFNAHLLPIMKVFFQLLLSTQLALATLVRPIADVDASSPSYELSFFLGPKCSGSSGTQAINPYTCYATEDHFKSIKAARNLCKGKKATLFRDELEDGGCSETTQHRLATLSPGKCTTVNLPANISINIQCS